MKSQAEPTIAWLQGFLHAFAWFNHKTDHGYTFALDILPKPGSVEQAIEVRFGDDLEHFTLTPIEDWTAYIREFWARWLFQFRDRSMDHLTDSQYSFSLFHEHFRDMLLDELMSRMSGAFHPTRVYEVRVETRSWYECVYEDIAFEEPERVMFLHAGYSD